MNLGYTSASTDPAIIKDAGNSREKAHALAGGTEEVTI